MPDSFSLQDVEKCFSKSISAFINGKIDFLAPHLKGLFSQDSQNVIDVSPTSLGKLQKIFPSSFWALKILANEFAIQYNTCRCHPAYLGTGTDVDNLLAQIPVSMSHQLVLELESLMYHIDSDLFTVLSGERYESTDAKSYCMLLLPVLDALNIDPDLRRDTVVFSKKMWINFSFPSIHAVRKLLNMTTNACLVLCQKGDSLDDNFYAAALAPTGYQYFFPHIHFTGHMEWEFCLPHAKDSSCASPIIQYKNGRFYLPATYSNDSDTILFQTTFRKQNQSPTDSEIEIASRLLSLVRRAHIGLVLILSKKNVIKNITNYLCKKRNRGFAFQQFIKMPSEDEQALDLLKALSSIDGAVLADFDGNFYACGVILDGEALVQGDLERGSRYNSAKNFIATQRAAMKDTPEPIAAVVASEDGMIDVFP